MKFSKLFFLGLFVVFALSCDKAEDKPEITLDDFVGSWIATSAIFTDNANTENEVDLISLGGEIRFTMLQGGGLRTWITVDTYSDEWDSQAEITGNTELTVTPVELSRGTSVFEFEFGDNALVLVNRNDSFDFTLSDADEVPATSEITFVPN